MEHNIAFLQSNVVSAHYVQLALLSVGGLSRKRKYGERKRAEDSACSKTSQFRLSLSLLGRIKKGGDEADMLCFHLDR